MKLGHERAERPVRLSPPTRGRGLKLVALGRAALGLASPPTRGRGLKLRDAGGVGKPLGVAPHAGAWIETNCCPVMVRLL